ncbi:cryptochrome/photolyase family protein [Fibrella aquatilis]|uniref:cryptochrome/photolyase family protein n=1 Tax=Fibrella aquatilis TaxID=2817059 RepID=UPI00286DAD2F|nr:cryptochrome/photolyase family protein [Fibrella aquatilis]
MTVASPKTLRLILGDQLNSQHSWFRTVDPAVVYVLMEMRQETDYAQHHIQKVVAFFLAMRHFADALRQAGHMVTYLTLDNGANTQSLPNNIRELIDLQGFTKFEYLLPDEYRLDKQLAELADLLPIETGVADTEHFYTKRDDFAKRFGARNFIMEPFYRDMRRKHGILMESSDPDAQPATGQWNYDADNRNGLPKGFVGPPAREHPRDVSDIVQWLRQQGVETMGTIDPYRFLWPVTRTEYLDMLDHFADNLLYAFGTYQDAMAPAEWSLFHSRLSFGMNSKLISPREVIDRVVAAYWADPERISYAQVEGFVRQILGWREYMRGVYWAKMPEFANLNFFNHQRRLPHYYWDADTRMNCIHHAVRHSLTYAYSHHIQRLMITGNFALLAGIHPDEVDAWYLGVYIDAIQWVEITNTRGMSQYADGGIVGTKPYVSSAAYINKMSHYCTGCQYDKAKKVNDGKGKPACPFNSLYWDFYDRNRAKLERNPRIV